MFHCSMTADLLWREIGLIVARTAGYITQREHLLFIQQKSVCNEPVHLAKSWCAELYSKFKGNLYCNV